MQFVTFVKESVSTVNRSNASVDFDIVTKEKITINRNDNHVVLPMFESHEDIPGKITIKSATKKPIEYKSIFVKLKGIIEVIYSPYDVKENPCVFTREMIPLKTTPGDLGTVQSFEFTFTKADKKYESYEGTNIRVSYIISVVIERNGLIPNISYTQEIWIAKYSALEFTSETPPEAILIDREIPDLLKFQIEINKLNFHLEDVIVGRVTFLLNRLKINFVNAQIVRKEIVYSDELSFEESKILAKFEIFDGDPVRGDYAPLRLFLNKFPLETSMTKVHNLFTVQYFLSVNCVDFEGRSYFQTQELWLWKKKSEVCGSIV